MNNLTTKEQEEEEKNKNLISEWLKSNKVKTVNVIDYEHSRYRFAKTTT